MGELVYHDGHYYRVERQSSDRRAHRSIGVWRMTHDLWDEVLYGVGSLCYKMQGR